MSLSTQITFEIDERSNNALLWYMIRRFTNGLCMNKSGRLVLLTEGKHQATIVEIFDGETYREADPEDADEILQEFSKRCS
jgi:hypothetical protein